ncbi:structural maintenance of chromosomes protein 6 isoform X1 [Polypterus senegalus]|uniref:structural maintenance of chromosomes protein 6 isoform X1 n=2 Tax=Polypterus senegalus TaxID=55291 RepID=UPI0019650C88|nr:structural maintenance of chromosomes protein 6 isoform X1 [Polypterus senegalus]
MAKRKDVSPNGIPQKRSRKSNLLNGDGDEESMQYLLTETSQNSHLSSGEVGIIESISLKNFMCHSLLGPFQFGPNVNFIVGNNGSGKSAVLTALIVGLGGKAVATNRGSSLKGFVKEGQSSAEVSITLRNRGPDAFKPAVYGDSIIIEQKISSDGVRSYKMKSKSGHVVSLKKEELISVMDHFNIQVDNPVSILTQEMSKHFLHSKGEGDKYKFFMKATQLEQMKEDYAYIIKTKTDTQHKLDKQDEIFEDLKRQYNEKEDRYKSLSSLDEMKNKLEELKHHMAWAMVFEIEKQILPLKDRIQTEEGNTVKYDMKVTEWKDKVAEEEKKYKEICNQLENITAKVHVLQPQGIKLKEDENTKRKAYKAAETNLFRSKHNLKLLDRDREQLEKHTQELRHSISQISEADRTEKLQKIEKLGESLAALKDKDATLNQQNDLYQQAIYKYKEEHTKIRHEQEELCRTTDDKSRQLNSLKSSRTDRIKRFGEKMPALLAAINEAHRKGHFVKKPIGPIGSCIRVKDPDLSLAVECCLKSYLLAFCCDNYKDEKVLQSLMSKFYPQGRRPLILVSEFGNQLYNTSIRAVNHPQFPSVLQVLEINDPVVANCLIDVRGIETVLLIKDSTVAREVMQAKNPPKNCREAFTRDGDQVFTNRYYSAEHTRAQYLSGDVEAEIRHLEDEVENWKAKLRKYQERLHSVDEDIKQNEKLLSKTRESSRHNKEHIRRLELEIADLQVAEEPQSTDIFALEEECQDICKKIETSKQDTEKNKLIMEKCLEELKEAERKYREHKDQINTITDEAEPLKEDLSKSDHEVEKSKHHRKHYEDKRKAHLDVIRRLKEDLANRENEFQESVAQAQQIHADRLEVKRSAKSLDTEISRLREKINTEQQHQGNREEIIRQYHEVVEKYKHISMQMKNLKKFMVLLGKIMSDRHKAYVKLRTYLSLRCKYYFDCLLLQRGYSGKMTFDHKNEALSIAVQPGDGDKAALNDMRSLSGGERSFSTVCFVLSLWGIAESPFRCLDEFDVYMDMVNRRISMDMMLKIADSQRYRQFIFLTPQSMSSLPDSNLIRILRMRDPDRGQTTLPYQRRNQEEE